MVTLTIDGRTVSVPEGTTILEAAQTLRISIPTLCYLKDINEIGACRICMVEVEGYARLVPSCDSAVSEGWWCTPVRPVSARPGESICGCC